MPTHAEAISEVLRALADPENGVVSSMDEIGAVGHRVVHGGESFAESVLIDEDVLRAVEACTPLAPLHNPANITGILACRAALGEGVPAGRRVRYGLPPDHARARVPLQYPLRLL